jgi:peptidoglycan-N-acetylglucosamine deacetylase
MPRAGILDRRAVLTIGAASLMAACSGVPDRASSTGTSRTTPASVSPSPSTVPSVRTLPAPLPGSISGVRPASRQACRAGPSPASSPGRPQQYVACTASRAGDIALTIDDGPDPTWTPPVLALLSRLDIRATFCVVGMRVAAHPRLVAAAADAGHVIANHTQTHAFLQQASPARVREEIGRATDAIVTATGGRRPALFRAPGGLWSSAVLAECRREHLRPLGWSVDPRDWSRPGTASIVRTLLTQTAPGSIILDHDGGGDRSETVQALGVALPRLLDAGYRFVQP